MAALAGVSTESFSKWRSWAKAQRSGHQPPKTARYPNPSLTELEQIASALKVAVTHLISEDIDSEGNLIKPVDETLRRQFDQVAAELQKLGENLSKPAKG